MEQNTVTNTPVVQERSKYLKWFLSKQINPLRVLFGLMIGMAIFLNILNSHPKLFGLVQELDNSKNYIKTPQRHIERPISYVSKPDDRKPVPPKYEVPVLPVKIVDPANYNIPSIESYINDFEKIEPANKVQIEACNISIDLPIQETYEPNETPVGKTEFEKVNNATNEEKEWSIKEDTDDKYIFNGLTYSNSIYISNIYNRYPRSAFGCGVGCISESTISMLCKDDNRSLEEVVRKIEVHLGNNENEPPAFISKKLLNLWNEPVYEIASTGSFSPDGNFYIVTKNGRSFYIDYMGPNETIIPVLKSISFN
jgi:hypothetical protein